MPTLSQPVDRREAFWHTRVRSLVAHSVIRRTSLDLRLAMQWSPRKTWADPFTRASKAGMLAAFMASPKEL
ncbi:MAG: hypothetical protein CL868_01650 [Cytophagaceae bacterium]|nr:hypothetical protein [Cytophagaceae bacterium]